MGLPYVALGVPAGDEVKTEFMQSIFALSRSWHGLLAMTMGQASVVAHARNQCVDRAMGLKPVPEWLLFLDSDMEFPHDTLHRLLRWDKNIVGAIYRRRSHPFTLLGAPLEGKDMAGRGLQEMARLPTGCLLIKLNVFERFTRPYFRHPTDEENTGAVGAEDYEFCRMAREKGFRLWCDHDVSREIAHIGMTRHKYGA